MAYLCCLQAQEKYMQRCLSLAKLGAGRVAPNPMVGAVLVYKDRIIGEGWHQKLGEAHAEVNCIASVTKENQGFISKSVLYVSLEPCSHFGKTPPCTDLIIKYKIPKVVIACSDPFDEVNGNGIKKLKDAGIEVVTGILEQEAKELNKRFFTFHNLNRPYIILKWAQTADRKIAGQPGTMTASRERLLISNEYTNRVVHRWRSEEAGLLIGTNTALADNPSLTNRLWKGNSPLRIVLDLQLKLPAHLQLFNDSLMTIVLNLKKEEERQNILYWKIHQKENLVQEITAVLCKHQIQSILIEGGTKTLQTFIDAGTWDEARVITNEELNVGVGIEAPVLKDVKLEKKEKLFSDKIEYFLNR